MVEYVEPKTGLKVKERNLDEKSWSIVSFKSIVFSLLKPEFGEPRSYPTRTREWGCFLLDSLLRPWDLTPAQQKLYNKRNGVKHQGKFRALLEEQGRDKFLAWFLSKDKEVYANEGKEPEEEKPATEKPEQKTFSLATEDGDEMRIKLDALSNEAKKAGAGDELPESERKKLLSMGDDWLEADDEEVKAKVKAEEKEQRKLSKPTAAQFIEAAFKKFLANEGPKKAKTLLAKLVFLTNQEAKKLESSDPKADAQEVAAEATGTQVFGPEQDPVGMINIASVEADGPNDPVYHD
jgi:hypothetical protein